jgi:hypothetical protein
MEINLWRVTIKVESTNTPKIDRIKSIEEVFKS